MRYVFVVENKVNLNFYSFIGGLYSDFFSILSRTELVDIIAPNNDPNSIGPVLFKFVQGYFEEETQSGRHVHPIYLQHDGNS